MKKEYSRTSRFKQFEIYSAMNVFLMRKGVFRRFNLENAHSVLDIGCGEAPELAFIAESATTPEFIVGIDVSPHIKKWKSIAKKQNCVHFVVASAHNLPLRMGSFDFVFIKDVLHHISRGHVEIINQAYNVVRCSGELRVIEANRYHIFPLLVYKHDKSHDHFTLDQIRKLQDHLTFDRLDGFELLPSFSTSKKNFLWNCFAFFCSFLANYSFGRRVLFLFINLKENLVKDNLTYYVLSKNKRLRC